MKLTRKELDAMRSRLELFPLELCDLILTRVLERDAAGGLSLAFMMDLSQIDSSAIQRLAFNYECIQSLFRQKGYECNIKVISDTVFVDVQWEHKLKPDVKTATLWDRLQDGGMYEEPAITTDNFKVVDGDITLATEDCICHQVNAQGVMGAGVAKALSDKWPAVKSVYVQLYELLQKRNETLLGTVHEVPVGMGQFVLNICGQSHCGRDAGVVYTDYAALVLAFQYIRANYEGKSLAFPYGFGCGLANGDWDIVYGLMQRYLGDMDVTFYRI